ncbi:MAG: hypothetical protein ACYDCK_06815, partial [Thermoplasmatota archaeon]
MVFVVSAFLAGCTATPTTPATTTPTLTPPPPPPKLLPTVAPPNVTWPAALGVNVTPGEPNE